MTILSVPDMTCGHCKAAVEAALAGVPDSGPVTVDLSSKRVTAAGPADTALVIAALDAAGYPAEVVAA